LHFLLQGSQSLIDIVVANEDLHGGVSPLTGVAGAGIFSASAACCEGDPD